MTKMLRERLSKPDTKNGFLLDGYPRRVSQARRLPIRCSQYCALCTGGVAERHSAAGRGAEHRPARRRAHRENLVAPRLPSAPFRLTLAQAACARSQLFRAMRRAAAPTTIWRTSSWAKSTCRLCCRKSKASVTKCDDEIGLHSTCSCSVACLQCGGKLVQRSDDQEATVRERLAVYCSQVRVVPRRRATCRARCVFADDAAD